MSFKPIITLVGRPNVGKSTLFNRLTKSRKALVADFHGLTRDRNYGECKISKKSFIVVDTGGFEPTSKEGILFEMAKQTNEAIIESDVVLFLVDARSGINIMDYEIAKLLRKLNKLEVILVINKSEGMELWKSISYFHELGFKNICSISSSHGQGIDTLIQKINDILTDEELDKTENFQKNNHDLSRINLAIVGRPNVGKSTFINTAIGEDRLVVFNIPGTTRDSVDIPFYKNKKEYTIIDTAGIRRKGRVFETIEKFSIIKTLQSIEHSNVILLILEPYITEQDLHIASFIIETGKSIVVAINKCERLKQNEKIELISNFRKKVHFLNFVKVHCISALNGNGVDLVFDSINHAYDSAFVKLSTPKLTRSLQEAISYQQPPRKTNFRPKMKYAHQGGQNPPTVIIHGSSLSSISNEYRRYLERWFREKFNLEGTPLRIEFKSAKNPYLNGVINK